MIYFLLPLIIFPLSLVLLTKFSRKTHPLFLSMLRQASILIFGLPILFLEGDLLIELQRNLDAIFLAGISGALYLFIVFKSFSHIEVLKGRVIMVIARILCGIAIGIWLLHESLNMIDTIGIIVLIVAMSLFLKIKNHNGHIDDYNFLFGFILSVISGVLFAISQYFFKLYSVHFSALTAGYILEVMALPFLILFNLYFLLKGDKKIKKGLDLKKKDFGIIFLCSAPVLFGSYGLALSYLHLDFILVNILFCGILVVSGIFSWLILGEKITRLQIFIFLFIIVGIFIVNYF